MRKNTLPGILLRDFLNLLAPRFCPVCGEKLVASEQLVCGSCLIKMPYTRISDFYENIVTFLFFGHISIERGYSHFYHRSDTAAHNLLMMLKYHHRPDIGRKMGRQIAEELSEKGFFNGIDGIVAVPLHWKKMIQRGYNQSAQIAKGVSDVTHIPVHPDIVRRAVNNKSQTEMKAAGERKDNVRDIFKAKETRLKHLLLVDDVLTTGTTIIECAKAIQHKNPNMRFSVMTLAKA